MTKKEFEESKNKSYKIIKNARTEIEKLQFSENLHNTVTEQIKQRLINLENAILNS